MPIVAFFVSLILFQHSAHIQMQPCGKMVPESDISVISLTLSSFGYSSAD